MSVNNVENRDIDCGTTEAPFIHPWKICYLHGGKFHNAVNSRIMSSAGAISYQRSDSLLYFAFKGGIVEHFALHRGNTVYNGGVILFVEQLCN